MSDSNFMNDPLPKGMEVESPQASESEELPAPVSLANGNYVAAIYQALGILPVMVRIDKCLVIEKDGAEPRVRLDITVLGEKEERDGGEKE